jgi:hypothetical protein
MFSCSDGCAIENQTRKCYKDCNKKTITAAKSRRRHWVWIQKLQTMRPVEKKAKTLFFRFFFSRVVMSIAQIRESTGTAASHKQETTKEQETRSELSS